jgi:putative ABC transport system permease protein
LINEAALKCFNWDNPIGKRINNNKWTVVGVVKDYYYKDMHNHIEPAVLVLASGEMNGEWSFAFRYTSGSREKVKRILESVFAQVFPNDPFEFHDLAEAFHNESTIKLYQSIKRSILFFTFFNIFLAIIGLYGLVSFATLRRTKEIGVRKINGGSVGELFLILNREFFVLLGFSLILAWPIAYMGFMALPGANIIGMDVWAWIPPIAALFALIIVLATTSWQTYRAATRNPIEALRYE